jgi:hypothetical protein
MQILPHWLSLLYTQSIWPRFQGRVTEQHTLHDRSDRKLMKHMETPKRNKEFQTKNFQNHLILHKGSLIILPYFFIALAKLSSNLYMMNFL